MTQANVDYHKKLLGSVGSHISGVDHIRIFYQTHLLEFPTILRPGTPGLSATERGNMRCLPSRAGELKDLQQHAERACAQLKYAIDGSPDSGGFTGSLELIRPDRDFACYVSTTTARRDRRG
jgi:hypothetical protein